MPRLGVGSLSLLAELELCDVHEQLGHNLLHYILHFFNDDSHCFRGSTEFPTAERSKAATRGATGRSATLGYRLYRVGVVAFELRWL